MKTPAPGRWQVASGHEKTTAAAAEVLGAGGNAVDAGIAAALAAAVAEPLLCSLGGGAHALVQVDGRAPLALDAFTHTPRSARPDALDFYPIIGNFGTDVQEFHVGMASIATPGVVAGLFALHSRFGRLGFAELAQPAIRLARSGVVLNDLQAYTLQILEPIARATEAGARMLGLDGAQAPLPKAGAVIGNPELADFLEALGYEGPGLFYRGEVARQLAADTVHGGGHLTLADLEAYRPRWRRPLRWKYRDAVVWSNPPPAFGGMMLNLASRSLNAHLSPETTFGSTAHVRALCQAMQDSEGLREQLERPALLASETALKAAFAGLAEAGPRVSRGTTQISVDDGSGLGISLTLSNGEGCGYVLPGTGIMLNNMLGEEDINRSGFHSWPPNRRLASMMAPSILRHKGQRYLLGSGGSNRIRTALTQVICNLVDFAMPLADAVKAPRIHLERGKLSIESEEAWPTQARDWWRDHHPDAFVWPHRNLFFGGVHAVGFGQAVADSRRSGAAASAPD